MCEELIYFCAKNKKRQADEEGPTQEGEEENKTTPGGNADSDRIKRLEEDIKKGKIEVAPAKNERNANNDLSALKIDKKKK